MNSHQIVGHAGNTSNQIGTVTIKADSSKIPDEDNSKKHMQEHSVFLYRNIQQASTICEGGIEVQTLGVNGCANHNHFIESTFIRSVFFILMK